MPCVWMGEGEVQGERKEDFCPKWGRRQKLRSSRYHLAATAHRVCKDG